jgi:putative tricarboxylic transport membrane protein
MIFGGVLIFKAFRPSAGGEEIFESPPKPKKIINAFFVMGVIAVFVALVNLLGFLVTSAVLLFILMKKLGVSLLKSAITSIVLTLFINLMFSKILRVPLPPGILGW